MSDKKRPLFSLEDVHEEPHAPKKRPVEMNVVGKPEYSQEADVRRVVIVGIDIPLTNIILLFLKFLLVVIPVVLVLGALLGVVWELATHGTL